MSETEAFPAVAEGPVAAVEGAVVSAEVAVPLAVFARLVGPRSETTVTVVRGRRLTTTKVTPGQPDEVWLRLLAIRHPNERHTPSKWWALIDGYRSEPAHPADPRFARSV